MKRIMAGTLAGVRKTRGGFVRRSRAIAAAAAASAVLTLGLAAPAHAAAVSSNCFDEGWRQYYHCGVTVGADYHYGGYVALSAYNSGWKAVVQPRGGFTLRLRVFPKTGGSIDYPAAENGRTLGYGIKAIQAVVVGHDTGERYPVLHPDD